MTNTAHSTLSKVSSACYVAFVVLSPIVAYIYYRDASPSGIDGTTRSALLLTAAIFYAGLFFEILARKIRSQP